MKVKLIIIFTALILLCSVTSAQNYSIRVTFNTNLRASASLQANIIETAPSGTTLNVVSELNRWLRIDRNGNEVWMADWVSHTRVESNTQTQTSTQTTSNIDNCCFVDRQCSTDKEWTDGYWAFQSKQCIAPAGLQTQTSTQTTSTIASQTDNCCFVDRQCSTDQDWTDGYWAFQNNQCTAPTQTVTETASKPASIEPSSVDNCCFLGWQCNTDDDWSRGYMSRQTNQCKHPGLEIEGPEHFIAHVETALDLLKGRASDMYSYVLGGLQKVRLVPEGSSSSVSTAARTYSITPDNAFTRDGHPEASAIWLAGLLAHEACHVYRYQAGLQSGGFECELACLYPELEVVETVEPADRFGQASWIRFLIANIQDPEYQWWDD